MFFLSVFIEQVLLHQELSAATFMKSKWDNLENSGQKLGKIFNNFYLR